MLLGGFSVLFENSELYFYFFYVISRGGQKTDEENDNLVRCSFGLIAVILQQANNGFFFLSKR